MARIRTIKPEFFQDEDLAGVSIESNLLAIGLLNHADDEGYFRANPALVQSVVFPLRETSMSARDMLTELSNIGYISLHEGSDGKKYGFVVGFTKHQRVSRPTESKIKNLINVNNQLLITDTQLTEDSAHTHAQLTEDSAQERKGKERKGKEGKGKEKDYVNLIFEHWRSVMVHPNAKLDEKRKRVIKKMLSAGYEPGQLTMAIDGCKATPWNMGENQNGTVYDSIELILRDAEHIDKFMKHCHSPPSSKNNNRLVGNQTAAIAAGERIS